VEKYLDRHQAGKILAQQLLDYAHNPHVIVLALPRGGVPVAYEIATRLNVAWDIFIVRKLGVPDHEELAMGAIAYPDVIYLNEEIINQLHLSQADIEAVYQKEKAELARREIAYRNSRLFPILEGKTVIIVDDGIATGATLFAAIKALRLLRPKKIVVAVPVSAKNISEEFNTLADEFICPLQPENFLAVGKWYHHFDQITDLEVKDLLKKSCPT
jgi:putative phosphoribosyl transferase